MEMEACVPVTVELIRSRDAGGNVVARLGLLLADEYLEFLAGRCRPNTVLAVAYDLKVFFAAAGKPPDAVTTADVLAFMTSQRTGGRGRLQLAGADAAGVSSRTLRRRLSSVSGLCGFLQARGDVAANPVPRGLPTRRERQRPRQGVPLVKVTRTLPVILSAAEVDALTGALRTHRDRAMVAAMVLGGLRRCEVLGLRLPDLRFGERRVFIAEGKGGHQRLIPVSPRFFAEVSAYLDAERPAGAGTDRVFVVLKGPRRGQPLSADGLDEILDGARGRAGLSRATCHQLRHTCLTRLREAGMALEAVQAQAGHASIESTRIYLHLADAGWPPSTARPPRPSTRRFSPTIPAGDPGERRPRAAARLGSADRHDPRCHRANAPLPGADRLRAPAAQRGQRGHGTAVLRRLPRPDRAGSHRPGPGHPPSHRGVQAVAGSPAGPEQAGRDDRNDRAPARHAADVLRPDRRMGLGRSTATSADVPRSSLRWLVCLDWLAPSAPWLRTPTISPGCLRSSAGVTPAGKHL